MNRAALLAASLALIGGALWASRARAGTASTGDAFAGLVAGAEDFLTGAFGPWSPPERAAPYLPAIAEAERNYGIPHNMLARLIYQESRFRADIISGETRSPAGALGIAQFMPATAAELNINPLDPYQAIDGAGRYLRTLYRQTGDWSAALAAYNWGIGNVTRKGLGQAPAETREYVAGIMGDIGLA